MSSAFKPNICKLVTMVQMHICLLVRAQAYSHLVWDCIRASCKLYSMDQGKGHLRSVRQNMCGSIWNAHWQCIFGLLCRTHQRDLRIHELPISEMLHSSNDQKWNKWSGKISWCLRMEVELSSESDQGYDAFDPHFWTEIENRDGTAL